MFENVKFEVGLVIKLPFPNQEYNTKFTYRPVIILEDLAEELKNLICPCTTQIKKSINYRYTITILRDSVDGKLLAFTEDSLLIIDRIEKISKRSIRNFMKGGKASKSLLKQIHELYKKFLLEK